MQSSLRSLWFIPPVGPSTRRTPDVIRDGDTPSLPNKDKVTGQLEGTGYPSLNPLLFREEEVQTLLPVRGQQPDRPKYRYSDRFNIGSVLCLQSSLRSLWFIPPVGPSTRQTPDVIRDGDTPSLPNKDNVTGSTLADSLWEAWPGGAGNDGKSNPLAPDSVPAATSDPCPAANTRCPPLNPIVWDRPCWPGWADSSMPLDS